MSSVRRPHGRLFQIRGPAAPKLLSPQLLCIRGIKDNRIQAVQEEFITLIIKQLLLIVNNAKTVIRFLVSIKKFFRFLSCASVWQTTGSNGQNVINKYVQNKM